MTRLSRNLPFWDRLDMSDRDGCWPYRGAATNGRGDLKYEGRRRYAYQVAWELANGKPVPPGLMVCHHCDNPLCARPDHLYAGTAKDNAGDAKRRGRLSAARASGLRCGTATVPPDVIRATVDRYVRGGISQAELAREVGVSQSTIGRWVRGERRLDANSSPFRVGKGRRVQLTESGWAA